jgi:poly(hydroxyalkanoate) depolymerase family esterase
MDWKRITHPFRHPQSQATQLEASGEGKWVNGSARSATDSRKYKLWVPASHDPALASPLLVMLHGCRQKPDDLARISGMNAVADRNNFLVVYAEQTTSANLLRCWNWFDSRHQSRGVGEPAVLAAVIEQVSASYKLDANRVYVAGISAGGAMAVILGVTYPDLISAVGVVAGMEYGAAAGMSEGLAAMRHGGPDPEQQGLAAFEAMSQGLSARPRHRVPVIVFQGDADPYVNPVNASQIISQWARTNQCLNGHSKERRALVEELTRGRVPGGRSFEKCAYKDSAGRLLMEKWMVEGMGHAWPGSPVADDYADPKGPNASAEMWRFFCETSLAETMARTTLWDRLLHLLPGTR